MGKDFYLVLQVSREASPEEIRCAFRRRAHELHPDKSGGDSEPFLELQEAYAVLSDPEQRAAYDYGAEPEPVRRGRAGRARRRSAERFREAEPSGGFEEFSFSAFFGGAEPSFEEFFDQLWNNFGFATRPRARGAGGLTVDVPLSAEEARAGGVVRLLVPVPVICPTCEGLGGMDYQACRHCRGQGALKAEIPVQVPYPRGLRRAHVVQVPLDEFGLRNACLTVRFRLDHWP
jgi:molecular chaperone DnaJ